MKKQILLLVALATSSLAMSQNQSEAHKKVKIGIGTSFFSLNESFDDLFFFNNSSPIYINAIIKDKWRIESVFNLSIIDSKIDRILKTRGSITLSGEYLRRLDEKVLISIGPRIGFNTNETKLFNVHIGGEYFFYKDRWSIGTEIGLNYLVDFDNYLQTNSSIILRFYL